MYTACWKTLQKSTEELLHAKHAHHCIGPSTKLWKSVLHNLNNLTRFSFFVLSKVPIFHRGGDPRDGQQRQTGQGIPVSKWKPRSNWGLLIIPRTARKISWLWGTTTTPINSDVAVALPHLVKTPNRGVGGRLRTRCDGKFSAPAGQQEALRDGSPQPGGGSGEAAVEEPGLPLRLALATKAADAQRYACAFFLWLRPVCPQDGAGDYMQFLRSSHQEALKEEERRHRFVAEKHCSLIQSIADIMNKVHGSQNFSWQYIDFFFFFS